MTSIRQSNPALDEGPSLRSVLMRVCQHEDINFLLTNRMPRRMVTRFMGWFSQIEQPVVRDLSILTWRLFADLELNETEQRKFRSLHDCFVRELRPGARPIDPRDHVLVSPCDGIVGAHGRLDGTQAIQAKGYPYQLEELLGNSDAVERYRDGHFVTLRMPSTVYHRFHAPHDATVERVHYIAGDTWNVNPIALRRVERLFCKNERAVIRMRLREGGHEMTIVPVGAILVASVRLHCLGQRFHVGYRGPGVFECDHPVSKGEEMGWFQHGSTIIVFAPPELKLAPSLQQGMRIRVGQPLFVDANAED